MENLLEQVQYALGKIKECEKIALERMAKSQEENRPEAFYEGQAIAYRNAAEYLDRIFRSGQ